MEEEPDPHLEAIALLLNRCPEIAPAWQQLSHEMEWDVGEDTGIYIVFGEIIFPFLLYALDGHFDQSHSDEPDWHISGAEHRKSTFRAQEVWSALPDRGSVELSDLVDRLYEVLEAWAGSEDKEMRRAVYVEMVDCSYYVDLSVQDLMANGGPNIRSLAEHGYQ